MAGKRTFGGAIEREIAAEWQAMEKEQLLSRMWARDATLWPHGEFGAQHVRENLEFLHIPESLPQLMSGGLRADQEALREGMKEKLLVSFGSVHHFCRAVLEVHPEAKAFPFSSLESCHPDALRRVQEGLDPRKMFIIFVNKSAYWLEDHAVFLHFHKQIESEGLLQAGKHFAAAADRGTYLGSIASEYKFRYLLELPAGVLAPYCSVLFLGLFLTAVAQVEPEVLRVACRAIKNQHLAATPVEENPAWELAVFLSTLAKSGGRQLRFVTAPGLASFAMGLCRLVGGSLGRGDNGLFPLVSPAARVADADPQKSGYIAFEKSGEEDAPLEECKKQWKSRAIPFLETRIGNPLDLLRQTYTWQVATVLCAARLGIYPFEPPDALRAQNLAGEALSQYAPGRDTLQRKPRGKEGSLQLFAEGRARQEISQLSVTESLRSFFQRRKTTSYLSLFVFLEQREDFEQFFEGLRGAIEQRLRLPVFLAWGPRSLDTYSHLLREEAPAGLHLVITADPQGEVNIPGAGYKFGQLYLALALGQFEIFSSTKGLALRLHVGAASGSELAVLEHVIMQALQRIGE